MDPTVGWNWVNGEGGIPAPGAASGYENWLPAEPNDYLNNDERYLGLGLNGTSGWNDELGAGNIGGFLVEVDADATLIIGNCDSGVANQLLDADSGCLMSDLIRDCLLEAENHGDFVSCVAQLTNKWKKAGLISGKEKGRIQSCAAQADIP